MNTEKIIRLIVGSLVLASAILAAFSSKWWLLLTAFVGVNLVQSVFTNWCLGEIILKKMGVKSGCCSEPDQEKQK
jgi:hypothetical protein